MCSPESRTILSTASKSFCPGTSHSRTPTPRTTRTNTTDIVSTTPDRGHDQPRPPDSRQHGELRTLTFREPPHELLIKTTAARYWFSRSKLDVTNTAQSGLD